MGNGQLYAGAAQMEAVSLVTLDDAAGTIDSLGTTANGLVDSANTTINTAFAHFDTIRNMGTAFVAQLNHSVTDLSNNVTATINSMQTFVDTGVNITTTANAINADTTNISAGLQSIVDDYTALKNTQLYSNLGTDYYYKLVNTTPFDAPAGGLVQVNFSSFTATLTTTIASINNSLPTLQGIPGTINSGFGGVASTFDTTVSNILQSTPVEMTMCST